MHLTLTMWLDLQNVARTFVATWKPLNMLGGTFFVVCLHQRHLSCCSLTFKDIGQGLPASLQLPTTRLMLFFLPFSLEKVTVNFCSNLKSCECMSQTLLYAFWAPKTSGLHGLLHFNLRKDQSLFDSLFGTSQYPIHGWFWHLKALNTCALPFVLLYSASKARSYPSSSSSTSKNNSDTLFDGCLTLSTLFYCFWGILTLNTSSASMLMQFKL